MEEAQVKALRNPYLNRVAIRDPAQFYGRRREVTKAFARLGAPRPQSISIVGDRRIGKSSLLHFINNRVVRSRHLDAPDAYAFAFIDLQQKRRLTLTEFFSELFALVSREIGDASLSQMDPTFDSVRSILERFRREGRKLVVLFDEFDAITANPAFDLEFYSFLRSIANNYDVAYVTSSARDLQELCRTQLIADSPFFNIFTNVFLRAFTKAEAQQLIAEPSADAGLPLAGYSRRIMEMAGQFPYSLQIACSAVFDYLLEHGGRLNREEVEATFLEEAKGQFRFIWDHMNEAYRCCMRDFVATGRVQKEQEHIYDDLKRAGYFIQDDRGPRTFSTLFTAIISRPRIITTELKETDRAAMALHRARTEKIISPPLIEPRGYIGRFNISRSLGAGGMGEIFEGYDTELHRSVAIKVLASKYVEDSTMKQRFLREARMASQLNHPNIATIYEIGEAAGNPYIVMEYVKGETLSARLAAGPLELKAVIDLGKQAAEALAEAHGAGVVHRDIKSANIMITGRGKVKILDFGLAKPLPLSEPRRKQDEKSRAKGKGAGGKDEGQRIQHEGLRRDDAVSDSGVTASHQDEGARGVQQRSSGRAERPRRTGPRQNAPVGLASDRDNTPFGQGDQLTESGILIGTVSYMSPEQASGKQEVTHLSDIFSLGVVLYEATTGRLPFDGDTYFQTIDAITRRAPPSIKRYRKEAPAGLVVVIERMLKKQPGERYQSAAEVLTALGGIEAAP